MALNDIYKLTLSGEFIGEPNDNVFYYRTDAVGSGSGSVALGTIFENQIMPNLLDLLSEDATFDAIEVVNLLTPIDFTVIVPSPNAGTRDSASGVNNMPSFLTATIQFNRAGPGTRYSYKRFSGILKADTLGNDLTNTAETNWIAEATPMRNQLVNGTWLFTPVQVKHPTPLGANPLVNFRIDNILDVNLGTQNTRKD